MAGLRKPYAAKELIGALKSELKIPFTFIHMILQATVLQLS